MEKKLDGNYTRILRAILNKSWRQHPSKQQLYDHQPAITKTIQVRRTRHGGHCWRSKDELISDILLWTPHMDEQRQDEKQELTYSSCVLIQDVALKTCQKQWPIEKGAREGQWDPCWWQDITIMMNRGEFQYDMEIILYLYIAILIYQKLYDYNEVYHGILVLINSIFLFIVRVLSYRLLFGSLIM